MNEAVFHCVNVRSEDEKIPLFIDGLSETICRVVSRCRESVHSRKMNFESLVHFEKSDDEAYPVRARHLT